jgi:hypothetical protein
LSIASEILSLRRDKSSSVRTLLALLEWQRSARNKDFAETRAYAAQQAADTVLYNVAIHAMEAQDNVPPARETRRTLQSFFRKRRRSDTLQLSQRQRKNLTR